MIAALVILLILGGGSGANLNLSDPAVLASFRANVARIIPDRARAANVSDAVYHLNVMSWQAQNPSGLIEQEIQSLRSVATSYEASPAEVHAAVQNLEVALNRVNRDAVATREIIRRNTDKGEWKKLLKTLAE